MLAGYVCIANIFAIISLRLCQKRPYQSLWVRDIGELTWLCSLHNLSGLYLLLKHSARLPPFPPLFLSKIARHRGFLFSYHFLKLDESKFDYRAKNITLKDMLHFSCLGYFLHYRKFLFISSSVGSIIK